MNEDNFVSAADTNRRFAECHKELRRTAVIEINRIIRAATAFPIVIPRKLLTDVPEVRAELLRKLHDESGWLISGTTDRDSLLLTDEGVNYYLWHPYVNSQKGVNK